MNKFIMWFKGLFTDAVKSFFSAVFTKAKTEMIAALKDIALQAVIEVQSEGISNDEKRRKVFDKIKYFAIARGIKAGDSVINLVLEMAVNSLKG